MEYNNESNMASPEEARRQELARAAAPLAHWMKILFWLLIPSMIVGTFKEGAL